MLITDICKSYGANTIFNNFSLEVEEGKVTCILGPSGAGKTTLLNIIAGLTDYSGSVQCGSCSYIFQQPRLVPNLTVRGNLALVCSDDAAIDGMLARVGLSAKAHSYPSSLSGGQARRVAIARAFLFPASAVLMDEPFASLDLKLKIDMMEAFNQVRARHDGRTALFVTHDIDEALYLSDRIIVLSAGSVIFDCSNTRGQPFGAHSPLRSKLIEVLTK